MSGETQAQTRDGRDGALKGRLSPLHVLSSLGQSVWIDFLSRDSIRSGEIRGLMERAAVVGATSNPTIFQKAMTAGSAYEEQLRELDPALETPEVFWTLAEQDIREACDQFADVWEAGGGRDGYVSIEVDPGLAYDTLATFREAMSLHEAISRPNLMVKIPATQPGLAAIEDAIAQGRSINITLIFSLARYEQVAASYIRGLERLVAGGGDPRKVASVASFFVSRIDTEADRRLSEIEGHDHLKGKLAVANARLAYQRLLWASTSVKDPAYPDTMYVEELLGADTVNTMPEETIDAYQDHGQPRARLRTGVAQARQLFSELAAAGVDYDDVTDTLEREGVQKFSDSFQELLKALHEKRRALAPA